MAVGADVKSKGKKPVKIVIEPPGSPWPRTLWHKCGPVYVRGYAHHVDGSVSEGRSLASHFNVETPTAFREQLEQANGLFAVVVITPRKIFAAVDRVRTIPLFYGFTPSGNFIISDSAEIVRKEVEDRTIDPLARAEFLHAGFVLGSRTLMPNVRQLQAGELLSYDRTTGKLHKERYYLFRPSGGLDTNKFNLFHKFDRIYEDTFSRLISWLDGRQAVIPLSGGYDSRLIALMLKELGYNNVLCFTYNTGGAKWEVDISRRVAKNLGFCWHYVHSNPCLSYWWYRSDALRCYQIAASNWASLPHLQDWFAIQQLKKKGIITNSSVIVPGIVAGSVVGAFSTSPEEANKPSTDLIISHLIGKWFSLQPYALTNEDLAQVYQDIMFALTELNNDKVMDIRILEAWEWQEREAKFLANSVRVYDWHGLDWYIPFCDQAVIDLWQSIAPEHRFQKSLHKHYVQSRSVNLPQPNPPMSRHKLIYNSLRRFIFKLFRYNVILGQSGINFRSLIYSVNGNGIAAVSALHRLEETLR